SRRPSRGRLHWVRCGSECDRTERRRRRSASPRCRSDEGRMHLHAGPAVARRWPRRSPPRARQRQVQPTQRACDEYCVESNRAPCEIHDKVSGLRLAPGRAMTLCSSCLEIPSELRPEYQHEFCGNDGSLRNRSSIGPKRDRRAHPAGHGHAPCVSEAGPRPAVAHGKTPRALAIEQLLAFNEHNASARPPRFRGSARAAEPDLDVQERRTGGPRSASEDRKRKQNVRTDETITRSPVIGALANARATRRISPARFEASAAFETDVPCSDLRAWRGGKNPRQNSRLGALNQPEPAGPQNRTSRPAS